jgi:hypothetical protein
MKLTYKTDKGFKYRRQGALLLVAMVAWFPYAAHTFFIFPSLASLAASIFLVAAGCIPLYIFARECFIKAEASFIDERN